MGDGYLLLQSVEFLLSKRDKYCLPRGYLPVVGSKAPDSGPPYNVLGSAGGSQQRRNGPEFPGLPRVSYIIGEAGHSFPRLIYYEKLMGVPFRQ